MSIDRSKGKLTMICDVCDDEYSEFDSDDFNDMITDARTDGWSVFKNDDHEWTHWCPDCKKEWIT